MNPTITVWSMLPSTAASGTQLLRSFGPGATPGRGCLNYANLFGFAFDDAAANLYVPAARPTLAPAPTATPPTPPPSPSATSSANSSPTWPPKFISRSPSSSESSTKWLKRNPAGACSYWVESRPSFLDLHLLLTDHGFKRHREKPESHCHNPGRGERLTPVSAYGHNGCDSRL